MKKLIPFLVALALSSPAVASPDAPVVVLELSQCHVEVNGGGDVCYPVALIRFESLPMCQIAKIAIQSSDPTQYYAYSAVCVIR